MNSSMLNNIKADNLSILKNHLETIYGISDKQYQERVWIRGEGPECDDYTESICHFFDDGDPIISNYKNYGISDNQLSLLINLRDAIKFFIRNTQYKLGSSFLYSKEWDTITILAQEVLAAFDYCKRS